MVLLHRLAAAIRIRPFFHSPVLPNAANPGETRRNCHLAGECFLEQLPPTLVSAPVSVAEGVAGDEWLPLASRPTKRERSNQPPKSVSRYVLDKLVLELAWLISQMDFNFSWSTNMETHCSLPSFVASIASCNPHFRGPHNPIPPLKISRIEVRSWPNSL